MSGRTRRGLLAALLVAGVVVMLPAAFDAAGADLTNTFTSSTTHHETHTRVDLAPVDAYETRVVAEAGGAVVFERTFAEAPGAPAVVAAVGEATSALAGAGACSVSSPVEEGAGSAASDAVQVGEELDHEETSVATTTTFGPATILIGEDQSQTLFVPAGSININTNTHTESFIDDLFQATVAHTVTYRLTGAPCGVPPPEPTTVLPERADAAMPVAAQPRTAG